MLLQRLGSLLLAEPAQDLLRRARSLDCIEDEDVAMNIASDGDLSGNASVHGDHSLIPGVHLSGFDLGLRRLDPRRQLGRQARIGL